MLEKLGPCAKHLQFLGYVDNTKLHEVFANADICILPSIWENFPTVCLESMAAGVPVIGSKAGGMAEMITHGQNGYLIEPKSPQELITSVLELTNNRLLLQQLSIAARQTVLERYNAEIIGKATEDIYWRTIKSKSTL